MDSVLNFSSLVPARRLGLALQSARSAHGVSLERLAASSIGRFSVSDLADIEAGRRTLSDADFGAVVSLYQIDNRPVFPPRVRLVIDPHYSSISTGTASTALDMTEREHILERYVGLLYHLREEPIGSTLALRRDDLAVLAESFALSQTTIREEIEAIMRGETIEETATSLTKRFLVPTVGVLVGLVSIGAIVMVPAAQASAQTRGPLPAFLESQSSDLSPATNFTESDSGAAFWTNVLDTTAPAAPLGMIDGNGALGEDPDVMTDVVRDDGELGEGGSAGNSDNPTLTDVVADDEGGGDGGGAGAGAGGNGIEDFGDGLVPNDGGAGSGTVGETGAGIEDSGDGLVPNDGGAGSGTVGETGAGIEDSGDGLVPNDGGAGSGTVGETGAGIEDSGDGLVPNEGGAGAGEVGVDIEVEPQSGADVVLGSFFLGGGEVAVPASAVATSQAPMLFMSAGDDELAAGTDVTADSIVVEDPSGNTWVSSLSLSGGPELGTEMMSESMLGAIDGVAAEAQSRIAHDWQTLLPDWTVTFVAATGSVRGETHVATKTIVVYVSESDTASSLSAVLAHELGHALDVTFLDTNDRLAWLSSRDLQTPWWPADASSDFGVGAGDFAEAMAAILADAPSFAVGGAFTPEQLSLAQSFIPFLS